MLLICLILLSPIVFVMQRLPKSTNTTVTSKYKSLGIKITGSFFSWPLWPLSSIPIFKRKPKQPQKTSIRASGWRQWSQRRSTFSFEIRLECSIFIQSISTRQKIEKYLPYFNPFMSNTESIFNWAYLYFQWQTVKYWIVHRVARNKSKTGYSQLAQSLTQ